MPTAAGILATAGTLGQLNKPQKQQSNRNIRNATKLGISHSCGTIAKEKILIAKAMTPATAGMPA
jgi:hypothetical protein